jgi:two-component system CheB/CheR fusion protein
MPRLLIVDDDAVHIQLWKLMLETGGHQIETADTMPGALEKLVLTTPEVLLMDLHLPELKVGLELIRATRAISHAKILVVSGWPLDLEGRVEEKLVDCVLAKPVRPQTLLRHVTELLVTSSA